MVHTALRETQEELGLAVSEEHVWGILQPVHDTVSHQARGHPHPFTHSVPTLAGSQDPKGQESGHSFLQA